MSDNKKIDKNRLFNAIVNASGSKINKNAIERAKSGDVSGLFEGLDEKNRRKLNEVLSDRKKTEKMLASKEAQELINKLSGGKKNG